MYVYPKLNNPGTTYFQVYYCPSKHHNASKSLEYRLVLKDASQTKVPNALGKTPCRGQEQKRIHQDN